MGAGGHSHLCARPLPKVTDKNPIKSITAAEETAQPTTQNILSNVSIILFSIQAVLWPNIRFPLLVGTPFSFLSDASGDVLSVLFCLDAP